jgi:hypothetical protein
MITGHITAIIPAAEKGRTTSMIGISWNTWFFKVRLHHGMPLCDKLEYDGIANISGDVVRVV